MAYYITSILTSATNTNWVPTHNWVRREHANFLVWKDPGNGGQPEKTILNVSLYIRSLVCILWHTWFVSVSLFKTPQWPYQFCKLIKELGGQPASLLSLAFVKAKMFQSIELHGGCLSQNLLEEAGDQPAPFARFRTFKLRTSCFPILVKHETAD